MYKVIIISTDYNKIEIEALLRHEFGLKDYIISTDNCIVCDTLDEAKKIANKIIDLGVNTEIEAVNNNILANEKFEEESTSSIGSFLRGLGRIMCVLGIIGGLYAMGTFEGSIGLAVMFSGIVAGAVVYGLGEIINTLHNIEGKLK